MGKYIEKYERLDLTKDDLSHGFVNKFKVNLTNNNGEIIIAIVDDCDYKKSLCDYCCFGNLGRNLRIDVRNEWDQQMVCHEFCTYLGRELEGIEANTNDREVIILKINSGVISVNQSFRVDLMDLKETICSVHCGGDINPSYLMRKGCWMKEENCCPLKLLINRALK
jgi:hypothetical protein